jgi:transposase
MTPDEQDRRARAVALVEQGHSYREAAELAGVPTTTVFRSVERVGTTQPDLTEIIREKAAEAAKKGVERMNREIEHTPDRNVAQWTLTTARLAGILDSPEGQNASDLGELVNRLTSNGSTVTVGVKVEPKQG